MAAAGPNVAGDVAAALGALATVAILAAVLLADLGDAELPPTGR